ncbi:MAG: sugar ABC transporter substrate-binding protein [Spirochaetaceae bacterium]|jgi:ABC-type sugar transport system substrate-binding protein|nr:sugar ABC transporter substrate-binding protein [Spirochaetaceae bacterium]
MRRIGVCLLVFAVFFILAGCSGKKEAAGDKITIAGIVFQDDEFMNDLINGMKKAAGEEDITLLTANTNSDQSREVELINTYVNQKVQGICIAPLDPNTSIATLRVASNQGVKVATVNMQLNNVDFLSGGYCSDDYLNGHLVGENAVVWVKQRYNRPVNIALLHFDTQVPAQSKSRYTGFLAALDEGGIEYNIVASQAAEQIDLALAAATDILTANPNVDFFFCAHGLSMLGAIQAVDQAGFAGKYFVFGYDINQQVAEMILEDKNILQASIAQDPFMQGYNAIKLLKKTIAGEVQPTGKTDPVPGIVLSRTDTGNVRKFLKDKYGVDR